MGAFLSLKWLGDKWFGTDVDDILSYSTPRVAVLRDRQLGALKFCFMFFIFLYIVIFNIFYKGAHFRREPIHGLTRLQLQQPTQRCNPMDVDCKSAYTNFEELPYCSEYKGENASKAAKPCAYYDAAELPIQTPNGLLLPSYIEKFQQARACRPDAANEFECQRKYAFTNKLGELQGGSGRAEPTSISYVADLEDFTLLLDHSFRVESGMLQSGKPGYDDYGMQGFWLDCKEGRKRDNTCTRRPVICKHSGCERLGMVRAAPDEDLALSIGSAGARPVGGLHGQEALVAVLRGQRSTAQRSSGDAQARVSVDTAAEEIAKASAEAADDRGEKVIAIKYGDVMSVKTLLSMAHRSLEESWQEDGDGEWQSLRSRGTAIVVSIEYSNMKPWQVFAPQDPPEYTISVTGRPVHKYTQRTVEHTADGGRILTENYGTLIITQVSGELGIFDATRLLIVMTTSLGLLAVSSTLTDMLAAKVGEHKDTFESYKFKKSKDANPS